MKALKRFFKREQNPFFVKLEKINCRHGFAKRIEKAFYLGGFVYSLENYERALKAVSKGKLNQFLSKVHYNTLEDNVEVFLIQNENMQYKIITILDPLELYQREEVLDMIDCRDISIYDQGNFNQIYP
jgi:hypothetical protein